MLRKRLSRLALIVGLAAAVPAAAWSEEVRIADGGRTLNANLNLADGKKFADGVILITHGALAHNAMEIIVAQQELLAERGFSTLAINLALGLDDRHGMYECSVPHRYRRADAMREIGLWVDWLKAKGTMRITVVGHSNGGNQTARYVIGSPDPSVGGAVLLAPATSSPERTRKGYENRYKTPLAPLVAEAEALVAAGKGAEMMAVKGFRYCPDTKVAAATFLDFYGADTKGDTPSLLKDAKIPVLVVAASEDAVIPDLIEKMRGMTGPRVGLVVVEGADHFFRDLYGEDAADAIQEFVTNRGN